MDTELWLQCVKKKFLCIRSTSFSLPVACTIKLENSSNDLAVMMCGQRPLWSGCSIEKMTCGPKHSKLVLVPQTNQRSAKHVSCALTCLLCPSVHVCVCVFVTTQSVGRRFGEFGGNLNNYTLCSPRVINYICGKGFLILESSTDKGWWWKRRARGAKKKRGKKEKRKKKPFRDRFRLYARLVEKYLFADWSASAAWKRWRICHKSTFQSGHNQLHLKILTVYWAHILWCGI